jgi:hypothetical protein
MSLRKMALVAAVGLSMASAPVMAQTGAPANRAGIEMGDSSDQGRGRGRGPEDGAGYNSTTTYIVAFFVIIVIGLGIYFALDDDDGRTTP